MTGEVQPRPELCQLCVPATCSFNSTAPTCNAPCPASTDCSGGSTLVPHTGYWHSAAMIACPNPSACQGDRGILLACQDPTNATGKVVAQDQVGHHAFLTGILHAIRIIIFACCMIETWDCAPGVSAHFCIVEHSGLSVCIYSHSPMSLFWVFVNMTFANHLHNYVFGFFRTE